MKYLFAIVFLYCHFIIAQSANRIVHNDLDHILLENLYHNTKESKVTPEQYMRLFKIRRGQQAFRIERMLNYTYAVNYDILYTAFDYLLPTIRTSIVTINDHNSKHNKDTFSDILPAMQQTIGLTVDHCCFAIDIFMHFPKISVYLFSQEIYLNGKQTLEWCAKFLMNFPFLIDQNTSELIQIFKQELDPDRKNKDYVNPYAQRWKKELQKIKTKKPKKKLYKGPQLSPSRNDL